MAILFTIAFVMLAVVGYKLSWHIGLIILFSGLSFACLIFAISRRRKYSVQISWMAENLDDLIPDCGDIDIDLWD